jgi:hypothetical protein
MLYRIFILVRLAGAALDVGPEYLAQFTAILFFMEDP